MRRRENKRRYKNNWCKFRVWRTHNRRYQEIW